MTKPSPFPAHQRSRSEIVALETRIAAVLAYAPRSAVHMADCNLASRFGVSRTYLARIRNEHGIEHEREPWEEESR